LEYPRISPMFFFQRMSTINGWGAGFIFCFISCDFLRTKMNACSISRFENNLIWITYKTHKIGLNIGLKSKRLFFYLLRHLTLW
jgi:hypothetical protein